MKKSLEELADTLELLQLEKDEEIRIYEETIQNLTLEERRKNGVTWFPLNIVKTGYAIGDLPYVIVERTTFIDERHKFYAGTVVSIFSEQKETKGEERKGIVHFVDKNKIKIILYSNPMPFWLEDGKVGINLLFDDRTFKEMEKAMNTVISAKNDRLSELREILLGHKKPEYNYLQNPYSIPSLNESQNKAVIQILAAKDAAFVHGPPGTGKTTTLVQAIKQLSKVESTILVCAPSNAATDLLTERLAALQLNVVRVGNISRVDESLVQHTLDAQISNHPDNKSLKKVKKQAAEVRRQARKYKRNFGYEQRENRRELYQQAKELGEWAIQLENTLIDQIINGAHVITCTLVGSTSRTLRDRTFKTVVIDEAAQALEGATWIPIIKAQKVVLVGDPLQLPPTIKSMKAQRSGLMETLLEKGIARIQDVSLLDTQYRMHKSIMGFSNQQFYENKLKADVSVAEAILPIDAPYSLPFQFIDTAGCGFNEVENPKTKSRYNPDEYILIREHLYQLLDQFADKELPSIGIISPYKEQVITIRLEMEKDERLNALEQITVNTIDSFQGQERDVIYISLVRSNDHGEIGFLADHRRMNVAMTRARRKLIMIGDSGTLGAHRFYREFLDYCESVGGYDSAWSYMV